MNYEYEYRISMWNCKNYLHHYHIYSEEKEPLPRNTQFNYLGTTIHQDVVGM